MGESRQERYRKLDANALDPEQRRLFDEIAKPRNGQVPAPFHIYLESPELCQLVQALGAFCRYRTGLSRRLSELAILVTAAHWKAEYEFAVHAQEALKAGVPRTVVEAIGNDREPEFKEPDEVLIYRFCRTFYETRDIPDDLFDQTVSRFGRRTVVELVGVLGYYSMLAIALRVFRTPGIDAD